METKNLADRYGLAPVDWASIEARLAGGPAELAGRGHRSWLGTIDPDGRPHLTGLGPQYVAGSFYFVSGLGTCKSRNLARDPRCSLTVSTPGFDLCVDGAAAVVDEPALIADLVAGWVAGGWPCEVDASGTAVTAPYSAPSAGPPPWHVHRLTPVRATVVLSAEPGGATRWTF